MNLMNNNNEPNEINNNNIQKKNINLIARIRPKNSEESNNNDNFFSIGEKEIQLKNRENEKYIFDFIADDQTNQATMFDISAKELIDKFLNGFNGTLLAYGQTGTGKSYTLIGSNKTYKHEALKQKTVILKTKIISADGILPRSFEYIHKKAEEMEKVLQCDISLEFSCFEIYNEKLNDLLDDNPIKTLFIREIDKDQEVNKKSK